jgi:hypothetical protein
MPEPRWPEVSNWVTSIKLLRPICELSVDQSAPPLPSAAAESQSGGAVLPPALPAAPGSDPIDPALWYCHTLNRLQLRLAPGSLTSVHPEGLSRLSSLSTLILSGNSLTWFVVVIVVLKTFFAILLSYIFFLFHQPMLVFLIALPIFR